MRPARRRPWLPAALLVALAHGAAPEAHAQPRAPIRAMQIVRPFVVQVHAREVSPSIPNCVTHRVWHGRLSPTDASGRRVAGRLAYFDRYEGGGCAVMSGGRAIGRCEGRNEASYDVVADVSAVAVAPDADGGALARAAAGSGAAPAGPGVLRARLAMRAALRAGTLRTNVTCLDKGAGAAMEAALAGQWFPFPPFTLPGETEPNRGLDHDLGGGNRITSWAWWRSDLADVPDAELDLPLGTPPLPRPGRGRAP